jgi:hypothetical protein
MRYRVASGSSVSLSESFIANNICEHSHFSLNAAFGGGNSCAYYSSAWHSWD